MILTFDATPIITNTNFLTTKCHRLCSLAISSMIIPTCTTSREINLGIPYFLLSVDWAVLGNFQLNTNGMQVHGMCVVYDSIPSLCMIG